MSAHIERWLTGGNRRFLPRNHIIDGLAEVVVVVVGPGLTGQKLPRFDSSPLYYQVW